MKKNKFYIITGGPGAGKTILLDQLQKRGYDCVPEVARNIIKKQVETGGSALPWADTRLYSDMMLQASIDDYVNLQGYNKVLFFDRGIPDTYAYEILMNFDISPKLRDAVATYRYNPTVFILPPWKEIYEIDNERKQDFEEAVRTYEVMQDVYQSLGYELIEVPMVSPESRADFVVKSLNK